MSKAFTKEGDGEEEDLDLDADFEEDAPDPEGAKNLMTPRGYEILRAELEFLLKKERPKIVEIVSWAAGNGDRSENGDYLYNKKRLREIDRRVRYLTKRLDTAEIVDPGKQQGLEKIFFGAAVTYARENGDELTVQLVGVDEADLASGRINWLSPVGKALMRAEIGDLREVRVDGTAETLEVTDIKYPLA